MERRTALAAAVAGAVTAASAAFAMAAVGGLNILGFTTAPAEVDATPAIVKQIATVDEVVVVLSSNTPGTAVGATNSAIFGGAASLVLEAAVPTAFAPAPAPAPKSSAGFARATSGAAPDAASAVPAGAQIPSYWPANTPIPPVPPGCPEPVLEDNGTWNCED